MSADPFDYYRNTDRLLCLLTLLPVLILAVVSGVSVFVLLQ
ncbi:putative membrane protein [Escherichia coli p0305293.8]|nr:putative membrane protein [Escherichia coli 3006]EKJ54059.1 putative membrane protein [Escherichia coli 0.1288]EMZ81883.1 putative membrane protein [Escherichia coli p0305293.1]ENG69999.1 putative membrane protein [Escherichia coli p0305293.8]KEN88237.1 putative membrane protein [Escherichia coli 2-474-04_S4_C1]